MTTHESAFSELAARLAGTDPTLTTSLRDILAAALQELIEAELTAVIGAAPGERTADRTAQRNGHRSKLLSTPAGDIEVDNGSGLSRAERGRPRALVHFAVSQSEVMMTTQLDGTATRFLPFNRGNHGGAGNQPDPAGFATRYLWEEVWQRESWLEILGRYLIGQRNDKKRREANERE